MSPEAVVEALIALHATDPGTVYLSVLARSRVSTIADLAESMYDRRTLVRWMAMRRTLFVFNKHDVPLVQAAISTPLAGALRRRLINLIGRNGIEPPIDGDVADWLEKAEARVEQAVTRRGAATGAEIRADVPALGAMIPARTASEAPQGLTSPLLTVMSTGGRLVRGAPIGSWTTRGHKWAPVARWWPDGLPQLDPAEAQAALARRWLERYGPATVDDLQWWTGWNKTATRQALAAIEIEEVDLHGNAGIDLPGVETCEPSEPVATLLPALDPTPMGWKHREWFTPTDPAQLYDTAGNIGPTVWWNGELIGGWASTPDGIRTHLLTDRGQAAAAAIDTAADDLQERMGATSVTPAARTPLERHLTA